MFTSILQANPVLKVNPLRLQYGSTDSNEGLKAVTNSLISKPLSLNDDGTKKVSASITQNAASDGRSMLNQTQMPKPSGLRMPSPSMGFFGQVCIIITIHRASMSAVRYILDKYFFLQILVFLIFFAFFVNFYSRKKFLHSKACPQILQNCTVYLNPVFPM